MQRISFDLFKYEIFAEFTTRGQVRGVIVVLEMVVVRVVWGVEYWVIKSTR